MAIENYIYETDQGDSYYIPIKEELAAALGFELDAFSIDPLPTGMRPRNVTLYREESPHTFRVSIPVPTLAEYITLPNQIDIDGELWRVVEVTGEAESFFPWLIETGPQGIQGIQGIQGVAGPSVINSASKTLTPNEVRALNSIFQTIVPALAGNIRIPLVWSVARLAGTVAYTGTATVALSSEGSGLLLPVVPATVFTFATPTIPTWHISQIDFVAAAANNFFTNMSVFSANSLRVLASAAIGGATADCPVKMTVWFIDVPFSF